MEGNIAHSDHTHNTHTYTNTHIHTHIHMHTHTRTHTYTHMYTPTCTHIHTHTHTHTHTFTHIHTHSHAHTHTHIHTSYNMGKIHFRDSLGTVFNCFVHEEPSHVMQDNNKDLHAYTSKVFITFTVLQHIPYKYLCALVHIRCQQKSQQQTAMPTPTHLHM